MGRVAAFSEKRGLEIDAAIDFLQANGYVTRRGRGTDYRQPVEILRFYELMEDAGAAAIYARQTDRLNNATETRVDVVYNWEGLLDDAQAGYVGLFGRVAGEWVFVQGPCIVACATEGSLSAGSPPTGTVGAAYSHTVTGSGLASAISVTGLPPGLSASGGAISGTPTEAGTYYAVATATADSCTLTKVVPITIESA